jgi:hypothetical protein
VQQHLIDLLHAAEALVSLIDLIRFIRAARKRSTRAPEGKEPEWRLALPRHLRFFLLPATRYLVPRASAGRGSPLGVARR